jgi:hypothetical protein
MYTPEVVAIHTKPSYIQFQFYRLMKNYFACLFLGFLLWLQSKSKKLPQRTRSKYLLNKVVNIIAPKVMRPPFFQKEVLIYATIT